jgi:hypothetical protein
MTLISQIHSAMLLGLKMKRHFLFAVLLIAVAVTGCSSSKKHPAAVQPAVTAPKTIITPDTSLAAKVISVNTIGRFVVLDFPNGQLPKLQQALFIYRAGLKTAEVKITGPQSENNIVADLVSGEAKVGDTVRDQ